MRYSEITGCFYPEWGNYGDQLPADVIAVPEGDFELALNRPPETAIKIVNGRVAIFTPEKTADELAEIAEYEAKKVYEAENAMPVTVGAVTYKGGESSASTIAAAVNLAQALGEATVTLVDANLEEHTMTLADALAVAAAVGVPARNAYFKHIRAVKAARDKK